MLVVKKHHSKHFRTYVSIVALLLLLLLVAFRFDALSQTLHTLQRVSALQVCTMFGAVCLTYAFAAGSYKLLALKPVPYRELLVIQIASGFANKLAPAGLGGMTLNGRYLTKRKHNCWQATAVAVTNNTLGFAGHLLLLISLATIAQRSPFPALKFSFSDTVMVLASAFSGITAVIVTAGFSKTLRRAKMRLFKSFSAYKNKKARLAFALILCLCITITCGLILWACVATMGAHITIFESLAVLTAGVFAGSIAPTPGGIGGAEAGLAAALAAIGLPASICLASALLYRLLTSWLPIVPGFVMFEVLNARKNYF
jgi:glycosyltransferase 2 family protein